EHGRLHFNADHTSQLTDPRKLQRELDPSDPSIWKGPFMNVRAPIRFLRPAAKGADTIRKSRRSFTPLVSILCVVAAVQVGGAASTIFAAASLTPLGDLPGGEFRSVANGVSADGSTVIGFSGLGAGQEAFRWTSAGGMVGLGDLSGGDFESSANGVSADGSVVV